MDKIKVMVEKEINIDELTTCLRYQCTQNSADEAALVIEELCKKVDELVKQKNEIYIGSQELQTKLNELEKQMREKYFLNEKTPDCFTTSKGTRAKCQKCKLNDCCINAKIVVKKPDCYGEYTVEESWERQCEECTEEMRCRNSSFKEGNK